jgi:hypothetical protein
MLVCKRRNTIKRNEELSSQVTGGSTASAYATCSMGFHVVALGDVESVEEEREGDVHGCVIVPRNAALTLTELIWKCRGNKFCCHNLLTPAHNGQR